MNVLPSSEPAVDSQLACEPATPVLRLSETPLPWPATPAPSQQPSQSARGSLQPTRKRTAAQSRAIKRPRRATSTVQESVEELEGEPAAHIDWSEEMEEALVTSLLRAVDRGLRAGSNGFKQSVWQSAVVAVKAAAGEEQTALVTIQRCKTKYSNLKRDHDNWQALKQLSGWSIDEISGCPCADEDTMDAYFAAHPQAGKFRYRPLRMEEQVERLFAGVGARGEFAGGLTAAERPLERAVDRRRQLTELPDDADDTAATPTSTASEMTGRLSKSDNQRVVAETLAGMLQAWLQSNQISREGQTQERRTARQTACARLFELNFELTTAEQIAAVQELRSEATAEIWLEVPTSMKLELIKVWSAAGSSTTV